MSKEEWMSNLEYLPEFMRDFHVQKNLFKTVDEIYERYQGQIDWRQAHIYTIDRFLWFMASRGYTLQKCRKQFDFPDIQETLQNINLLSGFLNGDN